MTREILLPGLPAENPLGFLASLGALVTARGAWSESEERDRVLLSWRQAMGSWRPVLHLPRLLSPTDLTGLLSDALHRTVDPTAAEVSAAACGRKNAAATIRKAALKRLKVFGRKASPEKDAFLASELHPALDAFEAAAAAYREALAHGGAADPILALADHPKQIPAEVFSATAGDWARAASPRHRRLVDLAAGLGCEVIQDESGNLDPTALSKANGSGEQFLLKDTGKIMTTLTPERLHAALFSPWDYSDEKLTLGWDPSDVQERAFLAQAPAKRGSRTMHGANRLAFEALALFPAVPGRRSLMTTGNERFGGSRYFTWAIWRAPLSEAAIRTLLTLATLQEPVPDRDHLARLGIAEVFRAEHLKINGGKTPRFSPARSV